MLLVAVWVASILLGILTGLLFVLISKIGGFLRLVAFLVLLIAIGTAIYLNGIGSITPLESLLFGLAIVISSLTFRALLITKRKKSF